MGPELIGGKVVTMTLSDIIAKGAKPVFFLASISIPKEKDKSYLLTLIKGIKQTCREYKVFFYGGDLNEGKELVITGMGLGIADSIVSRKGASIGDNVWSTGYFGLTGAAFHYLLQGGKKINDIGGILNSVLKPKLKLLDGNILSRIASSSMDSSDGLAITLNTIADINKVKIVVDNLPIPEIVEKYAKRNKLDPIQLAFFAGEEFEIIFTSNKPDEVIIGEFRKLGLSPPMKIGKIESGYGVEFKGEIIEPKGWEHFKQ
jgi:thiamine-monophosphate kinase